MGGEPKTKGGSAPHEKSPSGPMQVGAGGEAGSSNPKKKSLGGGGNFRGKKRSKRKEDTRVWQTGTASYNNGKMEVPTVKSKVDRPLRTSQKQGKEGGVPRGGKKGGDILERLQICRRKRRKKKVKKVNPNIRKQKETSE